MGRRIHTSISIAILLVTTLSAFAEKASKQSTPADAHFRQLIQQLYEAWSDLDPAKAAKFYAKDPSLTFFDIAPMKYTGWQEYAAGVPTAFSAYKSGKFMVGDDVQVHQHGNLTWADCTWTAELTKKDGSQENVAGRYTVVWERRGSDWLIVHEHMSVPLSVPAK